ncbi:hypothetical protein J2Y45_006769 [Dyadobacter sp. BE34]|uniref:Uncharacterized protein n=1 Tax=Dyadobacter fermentans TaxID=94254 RepID=A0ABU1R8K4_9BACT|nr:hypothetical protein [Dyadobacter fermentans]MDR7047436.1 hypothetical protein [Dyadobacter sp. BE242]MDR7201605.1 hypothetical protein [Dyadobacter sp. BE34]MDR7219475.1 hypothetical protein [Dyadobacter sp. BE31]MDR7267242.1 hypothetical protein [Dyadobacter sp. BE32]
MRDYSKSSFATTAMVMITSISFYVFGNIYVVQPCIRTENTYASVP